ncbi:MAG: PE-PGRS family protein [Candidatus Nomurabacteria bacterium GW2011_GWA2_42_41]|nr:MAG: PE-PGRS family protein [Candidatus Nomurabacteria bacterium GW2011_GWA2_42_41]
MKNIIQALKIIALALVLSFGISYVYAWTAPTVTPPGGNVSAPINTSATAQYKDGALGVGGLLKGYGNIQAVTQIEAPQYCIGASCITSWPAGGVTPPAGSEFLNTSATAQTKAGDFTVGGLLSGVNATFSKLGIGAAVDPSVALNVAGTIKTTGLQLATGAGSGKVLTSDSLGNTSWTDPVQATGGSGGGGFLEESFYATPGTYDFVVPSWINKVKVELWSAGGGGGSYFSTGGTGGSSSFGPNGAPLVSATGGAGGAGCYYVWYGAGLAAKGVGSPATSPWYAISGGGRLANVSTGGAGGNDGDSCYARAGGSGGYSEGIFSVTPGQTLKVIVGNGGTGAVCEYGVCGTAGKPGLLHLIYPPAPILANSQTFASNGTFTVPAGVTSITVEVWGGGGAGGPGGASQNYTGYWTYTAGGGGGSGGYAKSMFTVTPGATYSIVVGAGGSGTQTGFYVNGGQSGRNNEQGVSGASSSFGSGGTYASATGGTGGVSFDTYCGGGSCNGNISCGSGWQAPAGTGNGNFGNSPGSVGGACNVGTGGAPAGGKAFGAGGNGGPNGATTTNYPGSNGAVVISW